MQLTKNESGFLTYISAVTAIAKADAMSRCKCDGVIYIPIKRSEIVEILGCSSRTANNVVKKLCDSEMIFKKKLSENKKDQTAYFSMNLDCANLAKMAAKNAHSEKRSNLRKNRTFYPQPKMPTQYIYINNKNNDIFFSERLDLSEPPKAILKPTIVQDMLQVWREEFPDRGIVLTRKTCRYMVHQFKTTFRESLDEFRRYLRKIKTSAYLMREKFKLCFQSLFGFSFMKRVFAGEFGCKDPPPTQQAIAKAHNDALEQIYQLDESPKCKAARIALEERRPGYHKSWGHKFHLREQPAVNKRGAEYIEFVVSGESRYTVDHIFRELNVDTVADYSRCTDVQEQIRKQPQERHQPAPAPQVEEDQAMVQRLKSEMQAKMAALIKSTVGTMEWRMA